MLHVIRGTGETIVKEKKYKMYTFKPKMNPLVVVVGGHDIYALLSFPPLGGTFQI